MRMAGRIVERDLVVARRVRQVQEHSEPPRRRVIGARRITGETESTDRGRPGIQPQTAAKGDRPADALANHRIVSGPKLMRWPRVRILWTHRISGSKTEQRIGR